MGITVIIVLILLALAGAVTAPVVSLTCALVARARKLEVWRFALAGALFGVFIFPWPYVLVRIYGRSLHIAGLGVIYFFAYVLWLGAAATVVVQIVWIWEYTLGTSTGYVAPGGNVVSAVFMSALYASGIGVCVFGLFRSLRGLHGKYNSDRLIPTGNRPDSAYVRPFAYAYLWLVASLGVALVTAYYMVSIGVDIQGF